MMSKKNVVIILVLFLSIGFATVATNLIIKGRLNIGYNYEDFSASAVYTRAEMNEGIAEINNGDKNIDFETIKMENVNQTSILEFDVTNKSRNYDADVTIVCGLKEDFVSFNNYLDITLDLTSPFRLNSGETKTGHLTITMIKAYNDSLDTEIELTCTLVATPLTRDSLGDEYVIQEYVDKELNGADPVLNDDLIPITIANDGTVTYADISKEWYNYDEKRWANAVFLEEGTSYGVGDIILEEDIESYFVWIPRYRYQIFDEGNYTTYIEGKPATNNAKEIQIVFESKKEKAANGSKKGEWLTHPAFTNFDVNGMWVGKFETGYKGATTYENSQVNETDPDKVIIKPNVNSWRGITVKNIFMTAYNYKRELDSHMIKNTEWGAVAYLSHSKYGINGEININNNSSIITGYSAVVGTDQSSNPGTYGTTESVTLPYNTETGYKASVTGNITGIYDMSGGAWEYVAGYMPSNQDQSGFTSAELSQYSKYLDKYASNSTVTSWSNRLLGDATGEMGAIYYYKEKNNHDHYHNSWYSDAAYFIEPVYPWFDRGGQFSYGSIAGQFCSTRHTGGTNAGLGFRLVLSFS